MNKNKGFTLIELLVVIAIIGILSSVVLASLNSARNKGSDAAIKANLANARAQAELYADDNSGSYDNVCDVDNGIKKLKMLHQLQLVVILLVQMMLMVGLFQLN